MPSKSNLLALLGGVFLILALISKAFMFPMPIIKGGVEAQSLLILGNTFILIAIYLVLLEKE